MTSIDLPTLINWLISGFIGFLFGMALSWTTYQYNRRRDDLKWKRDMEKLQEQFEHEKALLLLEIKTRQEDLNNEITRQQSHFLRDQLMKGIENPRRAIRDLMFLMEESKNSISTNRLFTQPDDLNILFERLSEVLLDATSESNDQSLK